MNQSVYTSSASDVKALIKAQLELLWRQPELSLQAAPLMLWGAPGVGKSTVVRELCRELDIQFIDIRLAQREPVDLRGLPVPKDDHVDWLLAGEWPRDSKSRGIILFDELSAADRTLQAAAYEIILDRRLGDLYRLPDGWLVMGAGNRLGDRAVAQSFSSALANRFCHLEMEADVDQWCAWAQQRGLHSDVLGFLKFAPEHFFNMSHNTERGWPSPRSWERVAHFLQQAERSKLTPQQQRLMVSGLIGDGAAVPFFGFREVSAELPDIEAMLDGQQAVVIPTRNDAKFALCSGVVFHLWRDKAKIKQRLQVFFELSLKLSSDFATMLMLDAMRNGDTMDEQRANKLFSHTQYPAWTAIHGQQFAQALGQGVMA